MRDRALCPHSAALGCICDPRVNRKREPYEARAEETRRDNKAEARSRNGDRCIPQSVQRPDADILGKLSGVLDISQEVLLPLATFSLTTESSLYFLMGEIINHQGRVGAFQQGPGPGLDCR